MCSSWYDHSLNILWSNLEFVLHNESTWRFCSTSQYRGFLFMSPNKSVFFANKENGTHMFSPACFPWQLSFFSNTYIYLTLPLQISNRSAKCQQSILTRASCQTWHVIFLFFCLAFSFSIVLFFSPCLSTMDYAAASVLCDVPSCFWPSSTTLLKNVR